MTDITKEDLDTAKRAAGLQGTANGHRAALARITLALVNSSGTGVATDGNTLEVRVGGLEQAVQGLPDAARLESSMGDIGARLSRIEESLGLSDGEIKTTPKRRSGK